jgi:hypothetical protein
MEEGVGATPLWERSKENAAPLERGRNVTVLERALADDSDEDLREKERMVQHYERLVRPSEQEDYAAQDDTDDPLIHWLSYIKFHQEAFPSDTHAEFLLLERCMRALATVKRYANDVRFVRVCATYASKTDRATEVFQHLHRQKVGSQTAMFWAAWAWVVEKQEDFAFAEKIYKKGIMKNAMPIQFLRQRHQQFQRRLSRHWLNAGQDGDDEDDDAVDRGGRGALGALSEEAFRRNDRSGRAANSISSRSMPITTSSSSVRSTFVDRNAAAASRRDRQESNVPIKNTGFAIFVEEDAENTGHALDDSLLDSSHVHRLEREQDRKKENTLSAERWNDRGALSVPSYTRSVAPAPAVRAPTPPSFAVFVDEECAVKNEREEKDQQSNVERQRRHRDERTFREREDGGAAERLAKDPLRYVRDPSQFDTDQRDGYVSESHRVEHHPPDPPKSKKGGSGIACGFNRKLLSKDSSGQEQSFEEARASAGYFKIAPSSWNTNLLYQSTASRLNDSAMSLEESGSIDISMEDIARLPTRPQTKVPHPVRKALTTKSLFRTDASFDAAPTPRNISTASSTVDEATAVGVPGGGEEQTINTQFALRELSMMFSSPAFNLNESVRQVDRSGGLGPILNESGVSEAAGGGDTATFQSIADLVDDVDPDNSFSREHNPERRSSSRENNGLRNPDARSNSTPNFDDLALRTLEEEQSQDQVGCNASRRRVLGRVAQDDPLRALQEVDLPASAGFTVYEEEEEEEKTAFFDVYRDTGGRESQGVESEGDTATLPGFQVYEEEEEQRTAFDVYRGPGERESQGAESEGDTATLSLFGDALGALTEVAQGDSDAESLGSLTLELNEGGGVSSSRASKS